MSKWTQARIELAKLAYRVWTYVDDDYTNAFWLHAHGYCEIRPAKMRDAYLVRLTPAGRDALDREIGDTG